jgi:hypothetical protein
MLDTNPVENTIRPIDILGQGPWHQRSAVDCPHGFGKTRASRRMSSLISRKCPLAMETARNGNGFCEEGGSGRRKPRGFPLPHHRTYGSVYGGSSGTIEVAVQPDKGRQPKLSEEGGAIGIVHVARPGIPPGRPWLERFLQYERRNTHSRRCGAAMPPMQEGLPPSLTKLYALNSVIHFLHALQHTMPDHLQ